MGSLAGVFWRCPRAHESAHMWWAPHPSLCPWWQGPVWGGVAAVVAMPVMHRSAMELHFSGGLGFFHKHSRFLVVDFLAPIPTGCFFIANSSPLPESVLQTPRSSPRPHPHEQTHTSGWGARGCGSHHPGRSHSVCLSPTSCCTLLQAPELLFCPCWSPCWWGGFPRCGTFSFPSAPHPSPGVQVLSCFLSSFSLSSVLPLLWGSCLSFQASKVLC